MARPSFPYASILFLISCCVTNVNATSDSDDVQLMQKHINIDSSLESHAVRKVVPLQDENYSYPVADNYECMMFEPFSKHHEALTQADLNNQLADDSELPLWRTMQAFFSALPTKGHYLDVGCGQGRIVGIFGGLFDEVTCLEPDGERLSFASQNLGKKWGRTQKAHYVEGILSDLNGNANSFDAISFVHVAQHIPHDVLKGILAELHRLLKPDGVLIFATNHKKFDRYDLSNNTQLTAEQFDDFAGHPRGGVLAVRSFSSQTVSSLVQQAGFVEWNTGYTSWFSDVEWSGYRGPISTYVVAGKGQAWDPLPNRSNVPLDAIRISSDFRASKIKERRKCFHACPGNAGETPADFVC